GMAVGCHMRIEALAVEGNGDRDVEGFRGSPCCVRQTPAVKNVLPRDESGIGLSRTQLERCHDLTGHQLVCEVCRGAGTLILDAALLQDLDVPVDRVRRSAADGS